jgi:hypothetical protein
MLAIGGMLAQASGQSAPSVLSAVGGRVLSAAMVISGKTGKSGKANAHAARKARLAAALRENLKRRKQQARERAVAHKNPPAEVSSQQGEQDGAAAAGAPDFRRNRDEE